MTTVAIIPARGGSKQLPRKNVLFLGGKPLIAHTIEHARKAASIDRVFVSTEDAEIASISRSYGAEVITRPEHLAGDSASSESALLHSLAYLKNNEGCDPGLIVFLQCTSPARTSQDIDQAVRKLLDDQADSLFSACRSHAFIWRRVNHRFEPVNYDHQNRKRRQDMPEEFLENGSIYVFKPWVLEKFHNRLGGKVTLYEMDYWSSFQIDSREDFLVCEWILERQSRKALLRKLPSSIGAVIFDFDGVFTDNRVLVLQDGSEAVMCDRSDGLGVSRVKAAGLSVVVISTESNPVVAARCEKLGIECYQGAKDKLTILRSIACRLGISLADVIYVGNDVNDLECIQAVGCGVAVADASPEIVGASSIVLASRGGHGAVREVCDLVLESRGLYA